MTRDFKPLRLPSDQGWRDGVHRVVMVLLLLGLIAVMFCLAGCAGGGWQCSVRPVKINRDMAEPTMARDEKAVPGVEMRCWQR